MLKYVLAAVLWLAGVTAAAAQGCPVLDQANYDKNLAISGLVEDQLKSLRNQLLSTENIEKAIGAAGAGKLSGMISSLPGVASAWSKQNANGVIGGLPIDTTRLSSITHPSIPAVPAANYDSADQAAAWLRQAVFLAQRNDAYPEAATSAVARRRVAAVETAARDGYAVAVAARKTQAETAAQLANDLGAAGDLAVNERDQIAALTLAMLALQRDMAQVKLLRAHQLEIEAARALASLPPGATP